MKKIIIMLAITISTLSVFAREENVSKKVLDAFKTEFSTATNVDWVVGDNYYAAKFLYNEKYVFAYFNESGDMIGLTQFISPVNLPINLQINLKKKYEDYWITDLFEVAKNETTTYYITLENADTKLVLKAGGGSNWSVHNTIKKS